MNHKLFPFGLLFPVLILAGCGDGGDTVRLLASHQFPGGKGDFRDEMVQLIAREVKAADVGLEIRVYPGKTLYKPKEQWNAMVKDQLDIAAFPLAYAGGRHPEFNLTLMPGLVKNHEHARRINDSAFMERIEAIMDDAGVIVLAHVWLAGGFGSRKGEIAGPDSVKGMQTRAAGKAFDQMLAAAGASIASMPSSEIYPALQTGVLDACNTSSCSFVSYRLYEQLKHVTAPGDNALWFMYEPILMSKPAFSRLTEEQRAALLEASQKAEDYAFRAAKEADEKMTRLFKEKGVTVDTMSPEAVEAWKEIAAKSSYRKFAEEVSGGLELLDLALEVE